MNQQVSQRKICGLNDILDQGWKVSNLHFRISGLAWRLWVDNLSWTGVYPKNFQLVMFYELLIDLIQQNTGMNTR